MRDMSVQFFYKVVVPLLLVAAVLFTYKSVFMGPTRKFHFPSAVKKAQKEKKVSLDSIKFNITKPEISHLVDGKVKWTLSGDSIATQPDAKSVHLVNSWGTFVRDKDRGMDFLAPRTIYDRSEKSVVIDGGVKGKLIPENHEFNASNISWNEKKNSIMIENVDMKMSGANVRSKTMEFTPDNKRVMFRGDVRIVIPIGRKVK
jgi:hypothetical protein